MERRGSQMQSVTAGIVRHHAVRNVRIDNFGDRFVEVNESKLRRQGEHLVLVWKFPTTQFCLNRQTRHQFV